MVGHGAVMIIFVRMSVEDPMQNMPLRVRFIHLEAKGMHLEAKRTPLVRAWGGTSRLSTRMGTDF